MNSQEAHSQPEAAQDGGNSAWVQVIAVIKPFRAQNVLKALESIDVHLGTVREVMGFGRQKNHLPLYLGSEFGDAFLPKVRISIIIKREDLDAAVRAIVGDARTGRMGDGKLITLACYDSSEQLTVTESHQGGSDKPSLDGTAS